MQTLYTLTMASFSFLFLFFSVALVISSVSAEEYAVGGVIVGWRVPAMNATKLYTVWASRRHFYVGDSLRFHYEAVDSVVVVEKYGFYHCNSSKQIAYYHDGDTLITLDKPGTMYFITDDVDRCKQGVNMMVEVKSNNPPETPHNSTAPPEKSTPPPPSVSDPPKNSTPPPPSVSDQPKNSTPPPPSTSKPKPPPPPPPFVTTPPENLNSSVPPSPSDSVTSFAVTKSVTAFIVGLGVWALKA